jgi:hypothetical protein
MLLIHMINNYSVRSHRLAHCGQFWIFWTLAPTHCLCPPQALGCANPYTLELAPASGVVTVDTAAWPAEGVQPAGNFTVQPADASQGLVIVDLQVRINWLGDVPMMYSLRRPC